MYTNTTRAVLVIGKYLVQTHQSGEKADPNPTTLCMIAAYPKPYYIMLPLPGFIKNNPS